MRKSIIMLLLVLLVSSLPNGVKAATVPGDQPVVHAVLFWSNGCPHCMQVLNQTLPPLQDKYQSQLSLLLIEVVSMKDVDNLYSLGAALGLTKEQVGTPFLLIDRIALVGEDEIKSRLSGLIDEYLSSGGLEYPDIPLLNDMLSSGIAFTSYEPYLYLVPITAAATKTSGMAMAWGILILMGLAMVLAVALILRAFNGKPMRDVKGWLDIAIPVLSVIGLGVSIYLTYVELTHTNALCGPVGDCNAVQSSPYAKLFGFLPIGLLGAIGYVAILATWLWRRYRSDAISRAAGPIMFAMALFGMLFSIYLTYLELFVIHAVCIWCLSSAVIITALMLLNLPPITRWLAISDEEE